MFQRFFWISLQSLLVVTFSAQEIVPAGKKYNFYSYSSEDGLTARSIDHILQLKSGHLVICSRSTLNIFDGKSFRSFGAKEGLLNSCGMCAAEDGEGNLWIGGLGVYRMKSGKIELLDSIGISKHFTEYLYADKDGSIWAATGNRIAHYDIKHPGKPMAIYKINDRVRFITRKKNGKLIASGESTSSVFENDSFITRSHSTAYNLVEFDDGREWTSGWSNGIHEEKDGKEIRHIDFGTGIIDMIKDRKGNVWLVSWDKGVFKFDGRNFINFTTNDGLPTNTYWSVAEDAEGNIWFGSYAGYLVRYSGDRFTYLDQESGLISNATSEVLRDKKGLLWFQTSSGPTSYDPATGVKKKFETINGQTLLRIQDMAIDSLNRVWLNGYVNYQYVITGDKIERKDMAGGFSIHFDSKGNMWMGSDGNGAYRYSKDGVKNFRREGAAHSVNRIMSIDEDKKGNIWLASETGLIQIVREDTLLRIGKKRGMPVNANGFAFDDEGYYWISVRDRGLIKCSMGGDYILKWEDSLSTANGLPDNNCTPPLFVNNKMVIGFARGICVIDLDSYKKGKPEIKVYNKSDGLVNAFCTPNLVDGDNVWILNVRGAYCFNSKYDDKNTVAPFLHFSGVKLFFDEFDYAAYSSGFDADGFPKKITLPYNMNHLSLSFTGINFTAPEKVRYSYVLEGNDRGWSPESGLSEVIYPNLSPGTYTFMVRSCNNDGIWTKEPLQMEITITPPFWRTTWFYALCGLFAAAGIYLFISFREKKLRKTNQLLEDRVKQRTSQLQNALEQIEEKNKEITASINYASKIQSVLLPSSKEISAAFSESFIFFKPKDIVSGDFYWMTGKNDCHYLAVCDSTGHGVPGAFMSLLNINYLNEAITEKNITEPGEVFNYTRKQLISSVSKEGQKDGFDGILLCFKKNSAVFSFAAANNTPVMIRNGQLLMLAHDKMPVGKGEKDAPFSTYTQQFQEGDVLYLYTDGYADQFGGDKGKKFKYRQLDELLLSIHRLPAAEQQALISKKFDDWKGDLEQIDDICVIGIRL